MILNSEKKIVALVVTYNRKELLEECINAILAQKYKIKNIVVIDNNSSDGTELLFKKEPYNDEKILYHRLSNNIGGAGGFYEGIKYINENIEYDILWLMDDDTIALPTTAEFAMDDWKLLPVNSSFLASSVVGPDNEPMNVPVISSDKHKNGYPYWYEYLENGLVQIKTATFVSLFISYKAIKNVGLPIKEYFIWGDDSEYTLRLTTNFGPAYFSGNSKVLHKRFNAKALSILFEENKNRIPMFSFLYRNMLLNAKKYGGKYAVLKLNINYFRQVIKIIFSSNVTFKFSKVKAILKGTYQYYFNSQKLK